MEVSKYENFQALPAVHRKQPITNFFSCSMFISYVAIDMVNNNNRKIIKTLFAYFINCNTNYLVGLCK